MKSQFLKKYGYEYVRAAELNEEGCVNPKVVEKLDCQPPSGFVVTVGGVVVLASSRVECPPAQLVGVNGLWSAYFLARVCPKMSRAACLRKHLFFVPTVSVPKFFLWSCTPSLFL